MTLNEAHFEHQFRTLKKCLDDNNMKQALVHMDGSDESFAAAAFAVRALGVDNVVALITPDLHTQHVLATKHCEALGVTSYTIPVTLPVADILFQLRAAGIPVSDKSLLHASSMIASDVVSLVSRELNAFFLHKFYLNEFESHDFVRLYGLPHIEEDVV